MPRIQSQEDEDTASVVHEDTRRRPTRILCPPNVVKSHWRSTTQSLLDGVGKDLSPGDTVGVVTVSYSFKRRHRRVFVTKTKGTRLLSGCPYDTSLLLLSLGTGVKSVKPVVPGPSVLRSPVRPPVHRCGTSFQSLF